MKLKEPAIPTFKKKSLAKSPKKESKVPVWKKLGVNISNSECKDKVVQKLKNIVSAKAQVCKELIIGFNCVCKAIEKNEAAVLCISKDNGNGQLLDSLVEISRIRNVPVVVISSLSAAVLPLLKLKSVSCFCLKRIDTDTDSDDNVARSSGSSSGSGSGSEVSSGNGSSSEVSNVHHEDSQRSDEREEGLENDHFVSQVDSLRDFLLSIACHPKLPSPSVFVSAR